MITGSQAPIAPEGSKPSRPERCPCWKSQTRAPKLALMLIRLISTALIGRKTDPNVRNSTPAVTTTTISTATGTELRKLAMKSADREGSPPVRTCDPAGAARPRTWATSWRPASESGSSFEYTITLVVSPPIQSLR